MPDFIIAINDIRMKTKVFASVNEMQDYIESDPNMCFGVSVIKEESSNYRIKMYFDDSETKFGRTQSNIPK